MAITSAPYNQFMTKLAVGSFALDTNTLKVMLLADTYTPDVANHHHIAHVNSHQVTGTGYTAGGATVTNKVVMTDDTAKEAQVDADPVTWAALTTSARYAVLYKDSGTTTTSWLIGYVNFGEVRTWSAQPFELVFDPHMVTISIPA